MEESTNQQFQSCFSNKNESIPTAKFTRTFTNWQQSNNIQQNTIQNKEKNDQIQCISEQRSQTRQQQQRKQMYQAEHIVNEIIQFIISKSEIKLSLAIYSQQYAAQQTFGLVTAQSGVLSMVLNSQIKNHYNEISKQDTQPSTIIKGYVQGNDLLNNKDYRLKFSYASIIKTKKQSESILESFYDQEYENKKKKSKARASVYSQMKSSKKSQPSLQDLNHKPASLFIQKSGNRRFNTETKKDKMINTSVLPSIKREINQQQKIKNIKRQSETTQLKELKLPNLQKVKQSRQIYCIQLKSHLNDNAMKSKRQIQEEKQICCLREWKLEKQAKQAFLSKQPNQVQNNLHKKALEFEQSEFQKLITKQYKDNIKKGSDIVSITLPNYLQQQEESIKKSSRKLLKKQKNKKYNNQNLHIIETKKRNTKNKQMSDDLQRQNMLEKESKQPIEYQKVLQEVHSQNMSPSNSQFIRTKQCPSYHQPKDKQCNQILNKKPQISNISLQSRNSLLSINFVKQKTKRSSIQDNILQGKPNSKFHIKY